MVDMWAPREDLHELCVMCHMEGVLSLVGRPPELLLKLAPGNYVWFLVATSCSQTSICRNHVDSFEKLYIFVPFYRTLVSLVWWKAGETWFQNFPDASSVQPELRATGLRYHLSFWCIFAFREAFLPLLSLFWGFVYLIYSFIHIQPL